MIFVTVGTHNASFDRLIRWVDDIANRIEEPVIVQRGASTVVPCNCQHFRFCTSDEMKAWISQARVVITHGGATIREVLSMGRPAVVVPRLKQFREVVDNHQLDLGEALAQRTLITLALDAQRLEAALRAPSLHVGVLPSPEPLIGALRQSIDPLGS